MGNLEPRPDPVSGFFNITENYLHKNYGVKIRAELVRELCGELRGKMILDVGSGDGSLSIPYLEHNFVDFVDVSENMLNIIRDRTKSHRHRTGFYHLPFEEFASNRKYDLIIGIGILAHVPSVEDVIIKMSELLSTDGRVILQFSDCENIFTKLTLLAAPRGRRKYLMNRISYELMKINVAEADMLIERELRYSIMLPGMGKLPNGLLYKFTRLTLKSRILSKFGSDLIWLLKRKGMQ